MRLCAVALSSHAPFVNCRKIICMVVCLFFVEDKPEYLFGVFRHRDYRVLTFSMLTPSPRIILAPSAASALMK